MKRVFSSAASSCSSTTLLVVAVVVLSSLQCLLAERRHGFGLNTPTYSRKDFPAHFIFGSGTSAYQVEGAAAEDGRTPSIFDTAAHTGNSQGNGDVACDQYHKYKEDVKLMVDTGLDAYRFSISWSRIIPNGRGSTNPKGLQYYNNLINELLRHGIQPHVTLSHYDIPQVLEDEYGGWLSRNIVNDFTVYADVCFREFGDRVSHWTTINEANSVAWAGYDLGLTPPKRCSAPFGINCTSGNSTSEPYIVAHNCLLAHASAARLYKRKYQASQRGYIGLNILVYWFNPLTNTTEDILAIQRANDIFVGWFIDPLVFGDYPDAVKKHVVSKLPSFTQQESRILKGAYDFVGVNYYMTAYVKDDPDSLNAKQKDVLSDMAIKLFLKQDGAPEGEFPVSDSTGIQSALEYFKQKYGNPPIYIHENGQRTAHNASLNDTSRVKYLDGYIASVLDALRNGSDTRGYFTWSFLDLFELLDGYKRSFGLYYVDFNDPDLKRYPKLSALWYSNFLKGGDINIHQRIEAEKHIFQATIEKLGCFWWLAEEIDFPWSLLENMLLRANT